MGADFGYNFAATMVFKALAEAVPAYAGLRYPHLKDESRPAQVKHEIAAKKDLGTESDALKTSVANLSEHIDKLTETPRVGHKLHRLTTMTSRTAQFHLLAHGNPKPENLLLSPLVQFNLDGTPRTQEIGEAVGVGDRVNLKADY
jgi:hypothetical protein